MYEHDQEALARLHDISLFPDKLPQLFLPVGFFFLVCKLQPCVSAHNWMKKVHISSEEGVQLPASGWIFYVQIKSSLSIFFKSLINNATRAVASAFAKYNFLFCVKSFQYAEFFSLDCRHKGFVVIFFFAWCLLHCSRCPPSRLMLNKQNVLPETIWNTIQCNEQLWFVGIVVKGLKHVSQSVLFLQDDTGVYGHCQNDRNVSKAESWTKHKCVCVCVFVDLWQHWICCSSLQKLYWNGNMSKQRHWELR